MSCIDELRKKTEHTGTGRAFLQWWENNEEIIVELCGSAFLAGLKHHSLEIDKALVKGISHTVIEKEKA